MTNYEWLCQENKLQEFLKDVSEEWCDVCENWRIPRCEDDEDYELNIANWLQAERKVPKWVRVIDVLGILQCPHYCSHRTEFIQKINELETKEIKNEL